MRRTNEFILLRVLTCLLALLSAACVTSPAPRSRTQARPATGVEHTVQKGESLWKISRAYGVSIEMIALANELGSNSRIDIGQKLFIPGAAKVRSTSSPSSAAKQPAAPKSVSAPTRSTSASSASKAPPPQAKSAASAAASPSASSASSAAPPSSPKKSVDGDSAGHTPFLPADNSASSQYAPPPAAKDKPLSWPVRGVLYARFGKRAESVHDGIDIAAPEATPIRAAAAGTVLFSAPQPGYGNLVIIQHEGGLLTLYAHNRENLVKEGDRVRLGQVIARMGISSPTSGPYLHFEVRVGSVPKNPLDYLPPPR